MRPAPLTWNVALTWPVHSLRQRWLYIPRIPRRVRCLSGWLTSIPRYYLMIGMGSRLLKPNEIAKSSLSPRHRSDPMAEHSTLVPFLDSTGKPLPKLPKVIRPGTCAAVFNEHGEILLQKRADNGFWSMPGGAIDPGESVEQGALREVWEET